MRTSLLVGIRVRFVCACAAALLAISARAAEPGLVFSVKSWEGEYTSKDVPGGVEVTPNTGAIYTVNPDGTGLKKIIQPGKSADYPFASRDEKWVYYQSNVSGGTQVYRCKWDGSGATSLTPPDQLTKQLATGTDRFTVKEAFGYGLSADGNKMVFTVHDGKEGRVVIADADGSSPRFVAPTLGYTYMARLSPTSDRLVFSGPARGYRLLLATVPDGKPVELTPDHPECFVPQFTPDGKTIVFVRRDGDVYRVDPDGKNLKRLTEGNKYVEFRLSPKDSHGSTDGPDVSPDGKRIAFIARKDGVPGVFVMDLDGANRRLVVARKTPCGRVRWSPDGKQLSFVSFEDKYPQLFVVPAEGGDPRQLTKLDGAVNFAHWKPNALLK
jgi:Tol biopolymer transport system component